MANRVTITLNNRAFVQHLRSVAERLGRSVDSVVQESATRVRAAIIAGSPVDTGRLQASWLAPVRAGAAAWKIATPVPYAALLEYGGYRGVGPRTVALTGSLTLGHGLEAPGPGIYSTQAPYGFVRKALAQESGRLLQVLGTTLQQEWRH